MATLTRWDPFRELSSLQDRVNRLFQDTWGPISGVPATRGGEESLLGGSFVPAVDVYEDEQNIVLKMEVPGIDQKDIDIQVENNVLTVRGERKLEKEEKEENFQRVERRYGSFMRSFCSRLMAHWLLDANFDLHFASIGTIVSVEQGP
jgi:HSP20 family protein